MFIDLVKALKREYTCTTAKFVDTLKKELEHDLQTAFELALPLIERHYALYKQSDTFLGFILKLCEICPQNDHLSITDSSEQHTAKWRDCEDENQRLRLQMITLRKEYEDRIEQGERRRIAIRKECEDEIDLLKNMLIKLTHAHDYEDAFEKIQNTLHNDEIDRCQQCSELRNRHEEALCRERTQCEEVLCRERTQFNVKYTELQEKCNKDIEEALCRERTQFNLKYTELQEKCKKDIEDALQKAQEKCKKDIEEALCRERTQEKCDQNEESLKHEEEIARLRRNHEAILEDYRKKQEERRRNYEDTLKEQRQILREEQRQALEEQQYEYETRLQEQQRKHESNLQEQQRKHESTLQEQQRKHESTLQERIRKAGEQIDQLKLEVKQVTDISDQEMERLLCSHNKDRAKCSAEISSLQAQLEVLKDKNTKESYDLSVFYLEAFNTIYGKVKTLIAKQEIAYNLDDEEKKFDMIIQFIEQQNVNLMSCQANLHKSAKELTELRQFRDRTMTFVDYAKQSIVTNTRYTIKIAAFNNDFEQLKNELNELYLAYENDLKEKIQLVEKMELDVDINTHSLEIEKNDKMTVYNYIGSVIKEEFTITSRPEQVVARLKEWVSNQRQCKTDIRMLYDAIYRLKGEEEDFNKGTELESSITFLTQRVILKRYFDNLYETFLPVMLPIEKRDSLQPQDQIEAVSVSVKRIQIQMNQMNSVMQSLDYRETAKFLKDTVTTWQRLQELQDGMNELQLIITGNKEDIGTFVERVRNQYIGFNRIVKSVAVKTQYRGSLTSTIDLETHFESEWHQFQEVSSAIKSAMQYFNFESKDKRLLQQFNGFVTYIIEEIQKLKDENLHNQTKFDTIYKKIQLMMDFWNYEGSTEDRLQHVTQFSIEMITQRKKTLNTIDILQMQFDNLYKPLVKLMEDDDIGITAAVTVASATGGDIATAATSIGATAIVTATETNADKISNVIKLSERIMNFKITVNNKIKQLHQEAVNVLTEYKDEVIVSRDDVIDNTVQYLKDVRKKLAELQVFMDRVYIAGERFAATSFTTSFETVAVTNYQAKTEILLRFFTQIETRWKRLLPDVKNIDEQVNRFNEIIQEIWQATGFEVVTENVFEKLIDIRTYLNTLKKEALKVAAVQTTEVQKLKRETYDIEKWRAKYDNLKETYENEMVRLKEECRVRSKRIYRDEDDTKDVKKSKQTTTTEVLKNFTHLLCRKYFITEFKLQRNQDPLESISKYAQNLDQLYHKINNLPSGIDDYLKDYVLGEMTLVDSYNKNQSYSRFVSNLDVKINPDVDVVMADVLNAVLKDTVNYLEQLTRNKDIIMEDIRRAKDRITYPISSTTEGF